MRKKNAEKKFHFKYFLIIFFCSLFFLAILFFFVGNAPPHNTITWGVTFSKTHATFLGLDWKKTFLSILDELQVSHLRIPLYWNDSAPNISELHFEDYEWMMIEAEKRDIKVIPVLGARVPRWPECHTPQWLSTVSMKDEEFVTYRQEKLLAFVKAEVQALKAHKNIVAWQVENEPFFSVFGECDKMTKEFFNQEIAAVRTLDSRPILVTDSGELSTWRTASQFGDWLGFTMYLTTWNKWLGYQTYFFRPVTYFRKAILIAALRPHINKFIGVELQMEPWLKDSKQDLQEKIALFTVKDFRKNVLFARNSGFGEHYLWGVEWWYYLHAVHGESALWNEAKKLW